MQHLIYGSFWNDEMRVMLDPVSEDVARTYYATGEPVVIACAPEPLLGIDPETYEGPDGDEPATWSMHTQFDHERTPVLGFAHITFYNLWGLQEAKYSFITEDDGRLFLGRVHEFEYADPTDPEAEWSAFRQYTFQPDGYSKEVVRTALPDGSQDVQMTEYRGGDFSNHYEPVPEFGQWAGVLRRQR